MEFNPKYHVDMREYHNGYHGMGKVPKSGKEAYRSIIRGTEWLARKEGEVMISLKIKDLIEKILARNGLGPKHKS